MNSITVGRSEIKSFIIFFWRHETTFKLSVSLIAEECVTVTKRKIIPIYINEKTNIGQWNFKNRFTTTALYSIYVRVYMSRLMTKPTRWHVRPAKTQISLGIRPVWSESSLSAWRKLGSLATHWAHSEGSDQTRRMHRLIWVFAGRRVILLVLSRGGSNIISSIKQLAIQYQEFLSTT